MTTLGVPPRHRAVDPVAVSGEEAFPDSVRVGGVLVLTAKRYAELKLAAATKTGLAGRTARRRLALEDRRRARAISRVIEQGGFDIEGRDPGHRGAGGAGGGRTNIVLKMHEWRATTAQVAGGFWPFSIGASSPLLGTPLGSHLRTGQDFGCDPLSWFLAGLITAPVAFVLALNGFGKSSLVRRLALGNMDQGHTSLFLGDIKPDYAELTRANGGQVVTGGYGHQKINPLAAGALGTVLDRLTDEIARLQALPRATDDDRKRLGTLTDLRIQVAADLRARQVATLAGLVEINRGRAVEDFEETLLSSALDMLYRPEAEGGRSIAGIPLRPHTRAGRQASALTGRAGP